MARRVVDIYVPVVLAVPAVGVLLWGVFLAAVAAALIAVAVSTAHFSDGSSTVPTTLGDCAPFCAMRSDAAPAPEVTR
ncbi:hypothetical protein [Nocardia sp. NPDC059239]|uniref:hypothetical protein n=1 Tax=unclassified Nocardia TaxID=2637762 RepID=UPI00367DE57F